MNFDECFLCKRPDGPVDAPENECVSMCQDCGMPYCGDCFYTPCHDFCVSGKPYHYTNRDCPHWKRKT